MCFPETDIDVDTALTNCYYDGCIGVAFGFDFGCGVAGSDSCPGDYEDEILAMMQAGGKKLTCSFIKIIIAPS